MRHSRSPVDIIIFKRCWAKAWRVILQARQSAWRAYCSSINSNTKLTTLWKTVKFSGVPTCLFIAQLQTNNIVANNNEDKANVLSNHFQSICCSNQSQAFTNNLPTLKYDLLKATMETQPRNSQNDFFSVDELQEVLRDNINTALGHDRICYKMFKHLTTNSLRAILFLFNHIWAAGELPQPWLHSIIIPGHKHGKPSNMPSSYRPKALTSNVCKIMEKMFVSRLKWYLEYYDLLNIIQSGFRVRRRTTDHIMRLHDVVSKSLANKHHVRVVFVDIERAYDMVSKEALLKRLKMGVIGNIFAFIRSFLSNRSFQVRVGCSLSLIRQSTNGIP